MSKIKNNLFKTKFKSCTKNEKFIVVFCTVIFSCFILFLIISAVDALVCGNVFFIGSSVFFQDTADTFKDFFNVNTFVQDMNPYIGSESSYPPMVLLFAKIFQLIQGSGTSGVVMIIRDAAALIIYLGIFFVCFWFLLRAYLSKINISLSFNIVLYIAIILTSPMLFALDRGNYLLYAFLFVGYFLLYYQSEKRWQRELSYISLAFAVSFKLYPAIFAFLLLNEKDWLAFFKTVIYSVVLLIVPMFAFNGGFIANFSSFLENLFSFFSRTDGEYILCEWYINGYHNTISLSGILKILYALVTNSSMAEIPTAYSVISAIIAIILAVLAVAAVFMTKSKWIKAFLLTSVMTFVVSTNYEYNLIFFIFPMVMFLTSDFEEGTGKTDITRFVLFILIFIPLPLGYLIPKLSHAMQHGYPVLNLVQVAAYLALTIMLIVHSFKEHKSSRAIKQNEQKTDGE